MQAPPIRAAVGEVPNPASNRVALPGRVLFRRSKVVQGRQWQKAQHHGDLDRIPHSFGKAFALGEFERLRGIVRNENGPQDKH